MQIERMASVLGMLLGIAFVAGNLCAQPVSEESVKDLQRYSHMMAGKSVDEQLRVVQNMVKDAQQRILRGDPGGESILSQAGSWAKALGDLPLAITCWELMLSAPETIAGEFSALRMLGVVSSRQNRTMEAKEYFGAAIDLAKREPASLKIYNRSLVMVVQEFSSILDRSGEVAKAAEVREVVLQSHLEGLVTEDIRKWAMLSNARSLARAGLREEAVYWYDRYMEDGALAAVEGGLASRIRVQMARARLVHSSRPEELESAFQLIWEDSAFRNIPESAESGWAWAREFRKHGPEYDGPSVDIYIEIAERMKTILDVAGEQEAIPPRTERIALENLETTLRYIVVLAENAGRYHDALLATIEYEKRFGVPEEYEFIRQTADRVMEHLAQ